MRDDERGEPIVSGRERPGARGVAKPSAVVLETIVSPFHCLYNDALHFHSQSKLVFNRSHAEAGRLARAALLLYLEAAEALVHQAAVELGRPELAGIMTDPAHPLSALDAWRLLPAVVAEPPRGPHDPEAPPWPQLAELLALRDSWAYPGPPERRRAYYTRSADRPDDFEPIDPHAIPRGLGAALTADRLSFPLTGLPRDPYALQPRHLDAARKILDDAISALDRRLGGLLTEGRRHRNEPTRIVGPSSNGAT